MTDRASCILQLVTARQEAAALVEGYLEGMWLDMWILPNYIEAERGGYLQKWLQENAPQGSHTWNYQKIAGLTADTQFSSFQMTECPMTGEFPT